MGMYSEKNLGNKTEVWKRPAGVRDHNFWWFLFSHETSCVPLNLIVFTDFASKNCWRLESNPTGNYFVCTTWSQSILTEQVTGSILTFFCRHRHVTENLWETWRFFLWEFSLEGHCTMSFFLTLPTTEQRPSIFHSLSSLHGRKDFGVWGLGSSFMGLATWEPL